MKIFTKPADFQKYNRQVRASGASLGYAAALGAVHQGHMSLWERARAENDVVVSSIFVNPYSFATIEEADQYPVDPDADLATQEAAGVDALLFPEREDMYTPEFATQVTVPNLANIFEGRGREFWIPGTAMIITKLWSLTDPHHWYFGAKDAQQVALARTLARDLMWDTEIVPCPTIRESDGVPYSSRNAFLDTETRLNARALPRALDQGISAYANGEQRANEILRTAEEALLKEPNVEVEYVAIVDGTTFQELDTVNDESVLLVAAQVGGTRLLDNAPFNEPFPCEVP